MSNQIDVQKTFECGEVVKRQMLSLISLLTDQDAMLVLSLMNYELLQKELELEKIEDFYSCDSSIESDDEEVVIAFSCIMQEIEKLDALLREDLLLASIRVELITLCGDSDVIGTLLELEYELQLAKLDEKIAMYARLEECLNDADTELLDSLKELLSDIEFVVESFEAFKDTDKSRLEIAKLFEDNQTYLADLLVNEYDFQLNSMGVDEEECDGTCYCEDNCEECCYADVRCDCLNCDCYELPGDDD